MRFSTKMVKLGTKPLNLRCDAQNKLDIYFASEGKVLHKSLDYSSGIFSLGETLEEISAQEVVPLQNLTISRTDRNFKII